MLSRCIRTLSFTLVTLCVFSGVVIGQKLPPSTTIGSNPAGSLFYSVASGLAKVISEAGPMQPVVQPYTGSSTFLPLLDSGELDFGIINAVDMGLAYQGQRLKIGGRNPMPHTPRARLIMRGSPLLTSMVARRDGTVKTVQDVKGKRVTGEYNAHLAVWFSVFGSLATGGLTWNDVKVVPVPAVNDGIDALVQGRSEVSNHTLGSAKIKEADAAIGIRFVSLDCSPLGEARLKKAVPGYYLTTVKSGSTTGIVGDTCIQAYDMYLVGHAALPNDVVHASLKAVWDNIEKLAPLHPSLKEWTRERAVTQDATLPYHPAAVQFYKERSAWPPAMDDLQKRLLAFAP
jgi:TRAP transporter TAXI family solute receptor